MLEFLYVFRGSVLDCVNVCDGFVCHYTKWIILILYIIYINIESFFVLSLVSRLTEL